MSASLVALFHDEAARLVRRAGELAAAKETGSDHHRAELFRALHSLKGMCASVGMDDAARLAHEAEELARTAPLPARGRLASCLARLASRIGTGPGSAEAAQVPGEGQESSPSALPPIRVEPASLDRLIDTATRLSADLERLEHRLGPPADPESLKVRHALRREARTLGRSLLEMRLLRLSELADRFEESVHRWAAGRGVSVVFRLEGGDVRIDRGLAWRLLDPLAQLLRNAIAHGPDPRGRSRPLHVTLRAAREAGRLRFEVVDDGRGLDPVAVRRRAVRRGLIDPRSAARLDDSEALQLLARDGMSRLARADELAGRGVGLASVKAAIESLGGRLILHSRRGEGLSAVLIVPARLAITDALITLCGGRRFAVLAGSVAAVREPAEHIDGATRFGLAGLLGLPAQPPAARHVLTIETGRRPVELVVGRVVERRELVIRPLGAPMERLGPWAGAALLADGGLALVIDPLRLIRLADGG